MTAAVLGTPTPPPPPQIHALTGIRGIAAWLVVLYHIRLSLTDILPGSVIATLGKGYLAVDLFFMLSGFVMWLNYGSRFQQNGLRETPAFLWKRIARIWPLHALVLGSMVAFALLLLMTGRSVAEYPFAELPLHIALMQNWGLTDSLSWNHPAWSISTELAAYLTFPLIVCAVRWQQLGSALIMACLAAAFAGLFAYFNAAGLSKLGVNIAQTGLLRCWIEFFAGIMLANLWQRMGRNSRAALGWAVAALVFAVGGIVFALPETLIAPALIACGLMVFASDNGWLAGAMSAAPLRWLGDVSYATYLTHYFVFILFKILFVSEDVQMGWVQLAALLIVILALSAVLFQFFEKPAQRLVNRHMPRFARAASEH